jgi:hypothetical protein
MPTSLSQIARTAMLAQESGQIPVFLFTVEHPQIPFGGIVRLVRHRANVTSNGEDYTAFPVDITLPDLATRAASAQITFDDITGEITVWLRAIATGSPKVLVQQAMLATPDRIEWSLPWLDLVSPRWSSGTPRITADLILRSRGRLQFPYQTFNPARWPGVH